MAEHRATVAWERETEEFSYKTYNRDHTWDFGHGVTLRASAAPAYLGSEELVDPEQAFVASLSSCHLLTFIALAAMRKFIVNSYTDEAVGYLEKNDAGAMAITRVELHPRIAFADGTAPTAEQLDELHHKAHEQCFIANSVTTRVTVET